MKKLIYTTLHDDCWLNVSYILLNEDGTIYKDKLILDYDRDSSELQNRIDVVTMLKAKYGQETQVFYI